MIKAVILDCFGVLYIPVGEDFYRAHIKNYEQYVGELRGLGRQADEGLISQDEFIYKVASLANMNPEEVRERVVGNLARNQALLDYAQSLRQRCKLGLLTNISRGVIDSFFSKTERQELFDAVVVSSEVGLIKPEPAIYELAATRLGVSPSECVMVDDSQINCSGAIEAGMQAVVYQNLAQAHNDLESLLDKS